MNSLFFDLRSIYPRVCQILSPLSIERDAVLSALPNALKHWEEAVILQLDKDLRTYEIRRSLILGNPRNDSRFDYLDPLDPRQDLREWAQVNACIVRLVDETREACDLILDDLLDKGVMSVATITCDPKISGEAEAYGRREQKWWQVWTLDSKGTRAANRLLTAGDGSPPGIEAILHELDHDVLAEFDRRQDDLWKNVAVFIRNAAIRRKQEDNSFAFYETDLLEHLGGLVAIERAGKSWPDLLAQIEQLPAWINLGVKKSPAMYRPTVVVERLVRNAEKRASQDAPSAAEGGHVLADTKEAIEDSNRATAARQELKASTSVEFPVQDPHTWCAALEVIGIFLDDLASRSVESTEFLSENDAQASMFDIAGCARACSLVSRELDDAVSNKMFQFCLRLILSSEKQSAQTSNLTAETLDRLVKTWRRVRSTSPAGLPARSESLLAFMVRGTKNRVIFRSAEDAGDAADMEPPDDEVLAEKLKSVVGHASWQDVARGSIERTWPDLLLSARSKLATQMLRSVVPAVPNKSPEQWSLLLDAVHRLALALKPRDSDAEAPERTSPQQPGSDRYERSVDGDSEQPRADMSKLGSDLVAICETIDSSVPVSRDMARFLVEQCMRDFADRRDERLYFETLRRFLASLAALMPEVDWMVWIGETMASGFAAGLGAEVVEDLFNDTDLALSALVDQMLGFPRASQSKNASMTTADLDLIRERLSTVEVASAG